MLLAQMGLAMVWSSFGDSPTYDEPADIGAGVAYTQYHDLRWGPTHPPLARVLAALPLRLAGADAPSSGPVFDGVWEYELGREVIFRSPLSPTTVLLLARGPLIALTLLTGVIVYLFARDIADIRGGLIALAAFSFSPMVIAYGRLAATDMAVSACLLLTAWMTFRAQDGRLRWVVLGGAAYGLAVASKYTALPLAPVFLGLLALGTHRASTGGASRRLATQGLHLLRSACIFGGVALGMVWALYLAIDPQLRFDRPPDILQRVHDQPAKGSLPGIIARLPLPEHYKFGMVLNVVVDQSGRSGFLLGTSYPGGRVAFYPLSLAMKTPLPGLLVWTVGSVLLLRGRDTRRGAPYVLLPPVGLLVFAMAANTNIGVRHVLAVPLFLAVVAGAWSQWRPRAAGWLCGALLALSAAACWSAFPAYIAYVNEAAGGTGRAYKVLSDSNVDWGQDLKRLSMYLEQRRGVQPVWLAYFGTVDPVEYGIQARHLPPDGEGVHGLVAISVSRLNESNEAWAWLKNSHRPIGTIGGSILLYELP